MYNVLNREEIDNSYMDTYQKAIESNSFRHFYFHEFLFINNAHLDKSFSSSIYVSKVTMYNLLFLLITTFFLKSNSIVIIDKLNSNTNERFLIQNLTVFSDNIHDTVLNLTFEILAVVERCTVKLKIKMPESTLDQQYRREILTTSIDAEKAFKGIYGNYFTRSVMESYMKSADFELKYPFQKVRRISKLSK